VSGYKTCFSWFKL